MTSTKSYIVFNILHIIYKMDKDKITEKVYNDPLGFGSHHNTLKDARKLDPTITLQDISKWKNSNIERTTIKML